MLELTEAQLLDAIRVVPDTGSGEGYTVQELCGRLTWSQTKVRQHLKILIREQRVRPTKKFTTEITGTLRRVPSYVFLAD